MQQQYRQARPMTNKAKRAALASAGTNGAKSFTCTSLRLVTSRLLSRLKLLHGSLKLYHYFLSVQGALSVARSAEVSRFGSFIKPEADWF
jgi:hypothetical protein